tara:strand:- start:709 stop:1596 length:888 start_codon:yes stop_codon:yes gene_type:complete
MVQIPKISIILPLYNEEEVIDNNVKRLDFLLKSLNYSYEIILCDDNSKDNTVEKALELCKTYDNCTLLKFDRRVGKGGTLKNGLRIAKGELALLLDIDVIITSRELSSALTSTTYDFPLSIGIRNGRTDPSFSRLFLSSGYNTLVRMMFRTGVKDHQCGMKVIHSILFENLLRTSRCDGLLFDTELIVNTLKLNKNIRTFEFFWNEARNTSSSKVVPFRSVLTFLADLLILRLSRIRSTNLLKYNVVSAGSFKDHKRDKTHRVIQLNINVRNRGFQQLINFLRKIYGIVAFGKNK